MSSNANTHYKSRRRKSLALAEEEEEGEADQVEEQRLVALSASLRHATCASPKIISIAIVFVAFTILLLNLASCVVVYQVRYIASKSGRTDYALAGDSVELSCHYMMKDEAEDIKQLVWSKDGKNFLKWRKNVSGLEVLDYTFKGHVDPKSKESHLILHNVTIEMHGKYKCSIKTDLSSHEMEQQMTIISQSNCKLNDWRVVSKPNECRELFKLDCRNMFPKPEPSCGLWNGRVDKFIRSISLDISEEQLNNKTFRIKYNDKFELQANKTINPTNWDLLNYAGHLIFKCDISVPETSWKLSLVHRMFDFNDGCLLDPLESIERMRHNYSQYAAMRFQQDGYLLQADNSQQQQQLVEGNNLDELPQSRSTGDFEMLGAGSNSIKAELLAPTTDRSADLNCWQKPRIGSIARLSCNARSQHVRLIGANLLQCQQGLGWVPLADSVKPSSRARGHQQLASGKSPRASRRLQLQSSDKTQLNLASNELDTDASGELPPGQSESEASSSAQSSSGTIEIIPRSRLEEPTWNNNQQELSPGQLGALLPSCVSTRRHYKLESSLNRLPLLDESLVGGAASGTRHRNHHRMGSTGGSHKLQQSSGSLSLSSRLQSSKFQLFLLASLSCFMVSFNPFAR